MSFTPDVDLTLRQVSISNGAVSTDPNVDGNALPAGIKNEFYLDSSIGYPFSQLAFPVPSGTPLFYASQSGGPCVLIFD
jgi:hypothetical protein